MKSFSVFPLVFAASLWLAACSAVPMSSMLALSRIDFSTTRLDELRVAVELPREIRPRAKGVFLEVGVGFGSVSEKYMFNLVPLAASETSTAGGIVPTKGRAVFAYKLRDADVLIIEAMRKRMLDGKRRGEKGALSLGVGAKQFCRQAAFSDGPLRASSYISTSETEGFVAVLKDYDVRDDPSVAASLANMPSCSEASVSPGDVQ